ncbi:MAG: methyltransferase domain-containing protein [Actinomycetota bacterium]|nr:methyltransferase domain-containing protein [Actinomycetota bacterium]
MSGIDRGLVGPDEAGGNVYDKYASQNPVERRLVAGFMTSFDELVARTGASRAHEVGCGEGELSLRMARAGLEVRGSDAFSETIAEARRRADGERLEIAYEATAVQRLDPEEHRAELVVCCEVLEHLADPEGALEVLADLAHPWLIASVPREPLWRALNMARLSYLRELGNTPGHLGHWSKRGFVSMLRARVDVVEVRSPLPWTMALCRAR